MNIESLIINFSYLGIFLLMIANSFLPYISSQVLYIVSGYFISVGTLNLWLVLVIGTIGNVIGNILLFELTKAKGINYIMKFNLIPKKEIKKTEIAFRKKGAWFIFIGKLLPAIKVFVPIIAALGKMNRILYTIIIAISSFIWAGIFVSIGYAFGKSTTVFKTYAPIVLIIALIVMFIFYKYINSKEVLNELEK